jgi:hypothetical protein
MWVKLDDQFHDHPKVVAAGPMAELLYIRALGYCARYLTGGAIPRAMLPRLTPAKNGDALAETLVEVGLWEETDTGWQVHDYLDWNPSPDQVRATRKKRSELGRLGGMKKASNRLANSQANGYQNSTPYQSPSPYPFQSPAGEGGGASRAPLDAAPPPPRGRKRSYEIPDDAA